MIFEYKLNILKIEFTKLIIIYIGKNYLKLILNYFFFEIFTKKKKIINTLLFYRISSIHMCS